MMTTPSPTILPHSSRHRQRVVMHVDMDCFYAQVERERFPHWRGTPIAVVQNGSMVVTSNYRVRARGLPKMGAPEAMLEGCLALSGTRVNFAGSVMTRYRAASKAWYQIFQSFPRIVVMKKSIDESYLDLTEEANHRIRTGQVHRLVLQSPEERHRQDELARHRFAIAEAKWRQTDAQMLAAGVAPKDLESTGSLHAAKLWSRSMDPMSELRRQTKNERMEEPTAGIVTSTTPQPPPSNPKTKHLEGMTAEQIEEYCNKIHPINHCRADKRHPPCMLVPANTSIDLSLQLPGLNEAPWRQTYVGYVFLDGTDPKKSASSAPSAHITAASSSSSAATTAALDYLSFDPDVLAPSSSFAHEDPNNPSHDYMMAVGSQIAFEIRSKLFETLGFTTSSGIAPNCMLAKIASSLNKPNQQSVIRSSIASTFLRNIKLEAISGFGPKACEEVSEHNLVTVGDVQRMPAGTIMKKFDEKFAQYLIDISHGIDDTPVLVHGPPKSLGQSKRQRTSNYPERLALLTWLCEKLMERMIEDENDYHRRATVLTFSWLTMDSWASISRRCALPPYKEHRSDGLPIYHEMLEACIKLCKQNIEPNVTLRCLAIGVSQFRSFQTGKGITSYFSGPTNASSSTSIISDPFSNLNDFVSPTPAPTNPSNSLRSFFGESSKTPPQSNPPMQTSLSSSESTEMPELDVPTVDHSMIEEGAQREKEAHEYAAVVDEMIDVTNEEHIPDDDEIDALFGNPRSSQPNPSTSTTAVANDATPSTTPSASSGYTLCPTCSQSIPASSFVEHTDFHFAASFQAELRHQDRLQREKEFLAATSSSDSHSSANKRKKKSGAGSPAAARMSLDRFVVAKSTPHESSTSAQSVAIKVNPPPSPNKRPSTTATSLTRFFHSK